MGPVPWASDPARTVRRTRDARGCAAVIRCELTPMARTQLVILAGLCLFAPTATAADGPRTLWGHPVNEPAPLTEEEKARRAAAFPHVMESQGMVVIDNQVLPKRVLTGEKYLPPGVSEAGEWNLPPHRATVFLNFFGGPLQNGTNASEGQSPCVDSKTDYPGYVGKEQDALAIIQVFKDAAEPFGLRIAFDKVPPKHLPYSQVMMGGTPDIIGLPNGVLGVSCSLDCGDMWWRDTTFAFTEVENNVGVLGTTALQEAAHAWGLDHIDGENNIMYPFATLGTKVWADTCTPYNDATGGIGCKATHDKFCDGGAQNDVAELNAYFGANTPDTVAPTVVMLSPADQSEWIPGDEIHVEVEVSDDHEGYGWHLVVPELNQDIPVYNGQTAWDLKPPKGAYTIRVEAIDHDRNIGFAEAKIYIGVEPTPPEPMTTGEETDGPPTTSDSESDGEEGSDTSAGGDDPDKGCACRQQGPAPLWLLGLVGLGLRRRRR